MNTLIAAGLLALMGQGPAPEPPQRPITLNFSETDVAQIFRVIGLRTGTNVIYSGTEKLPVSLSYTANTTEEAVRSVAVAAGLSYRRVGVRTYIAAKPEAIKKALAPYAKRARLASPGLVDAEAYFAKTLPELTVLSSGSRSIEVLGIQPDIDAASEILDRLSKDLVVAREDEVLRGPITTEVVTLTSSNLIGVREVLKELYPDVKTFLIGDPIKLAAILPNAGGGAGAAAAPLSGSGDGAGGDRKPGGILTLVGRATEVTKAKAKALELDTAVSSLAGQLVAQAYDIQYSSPSSLIVFLSQMAPGIQVSFAPTPYVPSQEGYAGAAAGTGSVSGGASQTGTSSGGNSGGGGGTGGGGGGGISNQSGSGSASVSGNGTGAVDESGERTKKLYLLGRPNDVTAALKLLADVDKPPVQVVVDVRIVDTTPEFTERLGLQYDIDPTTFQERPVNSIITPNNILKAFGLSSFNRTPLSFNALLEAEAVKSTVKILARPSIQTLDNETAYFFVGDTVNYPAPSSGPLGSQNIQVLTFPVGIGLYVKPRVNGGDQVTMSISPFVSTITGILNGLPQTSTREANTTVMVKDGETLVLGGLIRDEERRTLTEVPFLSRLPLVGQLFRHSLKNNRRSNIIITLTPRIVRIPAQ